MKQLIRYTLLLIAAIVVGACSKEEGLTNGSATTGVLQMNISTTRAESSADYDPMDHLVVRIYNNDGELIRKYTSKENLPERLEMLAGQYRIAVELGEKVEASLTRRYYKGETPFSITAGQTTPIEVVCKLQNTTAEVQFDEGVITNFGDDFYVWVVVADKVDENAAGLGQVPALCFTKNGKGYFMLPEGAETLAWKFVGQHPERGEIIKEGTQKIVSGGKYTLKFSFSPDQPGYIECFTIAIDPSTDDKDDTIIFSPDPKIEAIDFDMSQRQDYITGKGAGMSYKVTTMAAMQSLVAEIDGTQTELYNVGETPADGITVTTASAQELTVTFSDAFFAGRVGGEHTLTLKVVDTDGGTLQKSTTYRLQGLLEPTSADWDLWYNTVTIRALIFDTSVTSVKFGLRKQGSEDWVEIDGTPDGNGYFTATFSPQWQSATNEGDLTYYTPVAGTGVFAGNTYECRATIGESNSTRSFTTATGDTIYNSGMELWSTYRVTGSSMTGGTVPYPNENSSTTFWVGGNNAQTNELCTGVTIDGSNGKCAQLKPMEKVGNFGAGNLFTGIFECGTGLLDMFGYARFGTKYTYSARPKALRVRYQATVGKYTNTGKTGMSTNDYDYQRIFVCIVDWSARHSVKSGASYDESTFWDPVTASSVKEGNILGYSSRMITESTSGWVTAELPIQWYNHTAAAPNNNFTLVISCATSYKGDYMGGCINNRLYVEDFEWVY